MEKEEEEALLYDIKNDCFTYSKRKKKINTKQDKVTLNNKTA